MNMTGGKGRVDKVFLGIVVFLLFVGILSFISASLGVLDKNESKFYSVLFSQIILGLLGGTLALIACSSIDYKFWGRNAFVFLILSIILTLLVFSRRS